MRALALQPGKPNSAALIDTSEPPVDDGPILLETLAVGVCGTDMELVRGDYGWAPTGERFLILGHESLCRVLDAPKDSGWREGDLAVGIVRRPDPVPCANCAAGEWDMCRNGLYTEHGIKQLHGFARERLRSEPQRLVKIEPTLGDLGVLIEPASILAKAWEHIERIGGRSVWAPRRVLVAGAGPIGLLAALMARQRGYAVDVLDLVTSGPKPQLVRDLGATYHHEGVAAVGHEPDIVIECTGVAQLVFDVMSITAAGGVVCLTGVSSGGRKLTVDVASVNNEMVLENDVVFGSVNANRRHYEAAAASLTSADPAWLARLISRRVSLEAWPTALERRPDDVKVVIDFQQT